MPSNPIAGGTNRGWPVRGPKAYAVQRLDWTGLVPFEIKEIKAKPTGFEIAFTKPVNRELASQPETYQLRTFTHIYRQGYGSPEVDQTTPTVTLATVSVDGMKGNQWHHYATRSGLTKKGVKPGR